MSKKRGQNEGSIRKRPDGTWEARVTVGIMADGKQKRKSLYGKTRQEVSVKMTDLMNSLQKGLITNPTEVTLSEWLDTYMLKYKKPYVKPPTYVTYTVKVENHIKPAIGRYKLKTLRQDIIQDFVGYLTTKGLAPATVVAIYKLLHNALERAVDAGFIARNVSDRVQLPKVPKPKIKALSKEEQAVFVEKAKETYMGDMYIFDLCTGMRLGELLGLTWEDVDWDNQQWHINWTISKVIDPDNPEDRWHLDFGSPKTEASKRTIPLHQTAIKLLLDVKERQEKNKVAAGAAYEDNDLVFCTKLGRPQDPINMRRTFYRICDKAELTGFHPHCLRHTFASRGVEEKVDVRVMQRFLGHANIQETVNTYTHIQADTARSQMELLADVVSY